MYGVSFKITQKDYGLSRVLEEAEKMAKGKPSVKIGVIGDQAAAPHGESGKSTVDIATFHEFGTSTIPQRSFLRSTVDAQWEQIYRRMAKATDEVLFEGSTLEKSMGRVGIYVQAEIQKRISSGIPPALSPVTVARKGSTTPLIDTGQLRASISFQVLRGNR